MENILSEQEEAEFQKWFDGLPIDEYGFKIVGDTLIIVGSDSIEDLKTAFHAGYQATTQTILPIPKPEADKTEYCPTCHAEIRYGGHTGSGKHDPDYVDYILHGKPETPKAKP